MMSEGRALAVTKPFSVLVLFVVLQTACGAPSRNGMADQSLRIDSAEAVARARHVLMAGWDTTGVGVSVEPRCFTRVDSAVLVTFDARPTPDRLDTGEILELAGFGPMLAVVSRSGEVLLLDFDDPALSMNETAMAADSSGWQMEPVDSAQAVQLALDALARRWLQPGDKALLHCYGEIVYDDFRGDQLIKKGVLTTWILGLENIGTGRPAGAQVAVSVHGVAHLVAFF